MGRPKMPSRRKSIPADKTTGSTYEKGGKITIKKTKKGEKSK